MIYCLSPDHPCFAPQLGQNFGGLAGSGYFVPQFGQKAAAGAAGFAVPQFVQKLPSLAAPQDGQVQLFAAAAAGAAAAAAAAA